MSAPPGDTAPEPKTATPYKYVPRISDDEFYGAARRCRLYGVIGAVMAVLLAVAVSVYSYLHRKTASSIPVAPKLLSVTQWTNDPGVNVAPAFSHDGKLVAYASDREGPGNLAIWLRPYPSGAPRRLTGDGFHATDPDFSPDDKQVVYYSDRDGGIYIVPAAGGEPRFVAKGVRPRFSPSGKWIAYYTMTADPRVRRVGKVYVIAAEGGVPRQIQPEFQVARYPVWLPGDLLLMEAIGKQGTSDWWVAPIDGGEATRTFAFEKLKNIGTHTGPERWGRGGVLFAATDQTYLHLWEIPLEPPGWQASGAAHQLSSTEGTDRGSTIGPDGRIMFGSIQVSMDIWSLPLDSNRPKPGGALRRVTEGHTINLMPAVAAKSDRMVYISNTTGGRDVWARDLKTGTTWALTSFRQISYRPVLSADGTRVAYPTRIDNQCAVVMQDLGNGASRNVNSGCFNLWDWSPDGSSLMVSNSAEASVSAYLWKVDTGQRQPLLSRADVSIYDAAFSPDGKWVAFSAGPSMEAAEVYVAPFHGTAIKAQEWILITQGGGSLTAWSPDGGFLYYQARRDGFHCIWAQQLGGAKHPQGEPQAILHMHTAALGMLRMKPSDFHMSVTKDRLILNLMQESSNLWITTQRE